MNPVPSYFPPPLYDILDDMSRFQETLDNVPFNGSNGVLRSTVPEQGDRFRAIITRIIEPSGSGSGCEHSIGSMGSGSGDEDYIINTEPEFIGIDCCPEKAKVLCVPAAALGCGQYEKVTNAEEVLAYEANGHEGYGEGDVVELIREIRGPAGDEYVFFWGGESSGSGSGGGGKFTLDCGDGSPPKTITISGNQVSVNS